MMNMVCPSAGSKTPSHLMGLSRRVRLLILLVRIATVGNHQNTLPDELRCTHDETRRLSEYVGDSVRMKERILCCYAVPVLGLVRLEAHDARTPGPQSAAASREETSPSLSRDAHLGHQGRIETNHPLRLD